MSVAGRIAERINRSYRYLKPLLVRGRRAEVLSRSGKAKKSTRTLTIANKEFVDFATTSYLGLDSDPSVIRACTDALQTVGLHRYISRAFFSVREYDILEQQLASIMSTDDAVVFPSATSLHQTLLPLLTGKTALVVADDQVHHSMHEALRACPGAEVHWIRHNDLSAMEAALSRSPEGTEKFVLADGIYSLSGQVAPVEKLYRLAEKHDALLYLDDSHGFGVFGSRGQGVAHFLNGERENLIYVGSLSKAIGCYGGFVATDKEIGTAIRDFAGGIMFSGPLPSVLLAGAVAATQILLSPRLTEIQARMWENQRRVVEVVRATGWKPLSDSTPIVCVDFTSVTLVESIVKAMKEAHVLASVVAFPAVPRGHLRIRLSVSANHTADDIECLGEALQAARSRAEDTSRDPIQAAY